MTNDVMHDLDMITASVTDLFRNASGTAWDYYSDLAYRFDEKYGKGWSKEHPEVIARMADVAARDFQTMLTVKNIQQIVLATNELAHQALNISNSIEKIG